MSCMWVLDATCTILTKCPAPSGPMWAQHGDAVDVRGEMSLQQRAERLVGLGRAARHDRRPVERPPRRRRSRRRRKCRPGRASPSRGGWCRCRGRCPVDDDVAGLHWRRPVRRSPRGGHHYDQHRRSLQGGSQGTPRCSPTGRSCPPEPCSASRASVWRSTGCAVPRVAVAGKVAGDVRAHDRQAGDADLLRSASRGAHRSPSFVVGVGVGESEAGPAARVRSTTERRLPPWESPTRRLAVDSRPQTATGIAGWTARRRTPDHWCWASSGERASRRPGDTRRSPGRGPVDALPPFGPRHRRRGVRPADGLRSTRCHCARTSSGVHCGESLSTRSWRARCARSWLQDGRQLRIRQCGKSALAEHHAAAHPRQAARPAARPHSTPAPPASFAHAIAEQIHHHAVVRPAPTGADGHLDHGDHQPNADQQRQPQHQRGAEPHRPAQRRDLRA